MSIWFKDMFLTDKVKSGFKYGGKKSKHKQHCLQLKETGKKLLNVLKKKSITCL